MRFVERAPISMMCESEAVICAIWWGWPKLNFNWTITMPLNPIVGHCARLLSWKIHFHNSLPCKVCTIERARLMWWAGNRQVSGSKAMKNPLCVYWTLFIDDQDINRNKNEERFVNSLLNSASSSKSVGNLGWYFPMVNQNCKYAKLLPG